jgi:hypothetical protein
VPFVNRATGQLFPSAESKSDVEERKKSAAAQRGKNMSLVDSRRLDEQRGSKRKRIQKPSILPRDRQSTIMCSWELKRDLLSLSLFLSLFLATKRKKRTRYATTNINTHLRRARYRSSFVLRPTFEVEIIKCKQLINQCGVLVWSLSRIYWFRV